MTRIKITKCVWVGFLLIAYPVAFCGCDSGLGAGVAGFRTVDHDFDDLTSFQLSQAALTRIYFEHASIRGNISNGLDDLETLDSAYDRSNFVFLNRGNPGWQEKIDGFASNLNAASPSPDDYDAVTMKYCYIDSGADFAYYRDVMVDLERTYPGTVFVWWTMPIQTDGSAQRDAFNHAVRSYCRANGRLLFDIADIESHDPDGNAVTDAGYEAMWPAYSDDGGHLNETGRERVARAFWDLAYIVSRQ